jgi:phospholipid/cholesterol/gamma-HCH transport system substrate-binding protein
MIPVEPDEALGAITDLLTSLQPASVARILEEGAQAIDGTGNTINRTLLELSQLIPYLAQQDDEFKAIADDVNRLANAIRSRDDEIAKLLDDFATVSTTLAAERDDIISFVETLASLAREGQALLTAYETTIPADLDAVASVALTIEANGRSVQQTLLSFQGFQSGVLDAYEDEFGTIHARVQTSGMVMNQLEPIFELIGLLTG